MSEEKKEEPKTEQENLIEVKTEEDKKEEVKTEEVKTEEVKVEEKKEEIKKDRKDMSLVEAVVDALGGDLEDIELTPRVKKMMKKLPAVDGKYLKNIESFFDKIVEDKEINAHDIPLLLALMQELFLLYDELRMKVSSFEVGQTLKVLVQILMLYKLKDSDVLTQEQKDGIFSSMDVLVQMSSNMIELKDTAKQARSWLNWILKFACRRGNQGSPYPPPV
jgi:hypothetical protein